MSIYPWWIRAIAIALLLGVFVPAIWALWSGDWRWLLVTGICCIILAMG